MSINAQGQIADSKWKSVGLVSKEKLIQDAQARKIAFIDGQGNLIDTIRKLGRMSKDGKTDGNANGDLIFTTKDRPDNTGDISDVRGAKIGNVRDIIEARPDRGTTCALHCFQHQHPQWQ